MKTVKTLFTCVILTILSTASKAQDWKSLNADDLFSMARKEVFEGRRAAGQQKLQYILEKDPAYTEVRIFLARSHAWAGSYDRARTTLEEVLRMSPMHVDAMRALIDVALWSKDYEGALALAEEAIAKYPHDTKFLYQRGQALIFIGRGREALHVLMSVLALDPTHSTAEKLHDSLYIASANYIAMVRSGVEFFDRAIGSSVYVTAQAGRESAWGSAHIRVNYAQRFATSGYQSEVDLYPRLSKSVNAYLNYGYSASDLFPQHRAGVELFVKLPAALEASAGATMMQFQGASGIIIITGSAGWYFRDYWFSARTFITPRAAGATSASATFYARRYFNSEDDFLEFNGGFGVSPDPTRMQNSQRVNDTEVHLLKSQRAAVAFQKRLRPAWALNVTIEVARQALLFDPNEHVRVGGVFVLVKRRF